jgi:osmoprotectant transport system ATP-binding protein
MAIETKSLTKKFGDVMAVDDLSIQFADNSLNVLIGPSGCGKTTMLRMLNRLIEPTSGDILFDGVSIIDIDPIELRRSIGYVIQEIGLFPHMTIYENIATVPRLLGWKESRIRDRVGELLELVNMDPERFPTQYPAQLSGGQRQRIGVARGLAADPQILLMDEPFGAIDPINREKLQDSFMEIQRAIQKTIVFVTHDIREAVKLADKIAILRQGRLEQYDDTIRLINNPKNEFVESLLGADRALKGLDLVKVRDTYDPDYFSVSMKDAATSSVKDVAKLLEDAGRPFAFVKDRNDKLQGYVLRRDLEQADGREHAEEHLRPIESVRQNTTLMEAISLMVTSGITAVPVVDDRDRMLGVMRFTTVFKKVEEMAHAGEEE